MKKDEKIYSNYYSITNFFIAFSLPVSATVTYPTLTPADDATGIWVNRSNLIVNITSSTGHTMNGTITLSSNRRYTYHFISNEQHTNHDHRNRQPSIRCLNYISMVCKCD